MRLGCCECVWMYRACLVLDGGASVARAYRRGSRDAGSGGALAGIALTAGRAAGQAVG